MSGAISFSQIPPNLRIPLLSIEFDTSQAGVAQFAQNTLIIGETTNVAAPTGVEFAPSLAWVQTTYGVKSMLAAMFAAYTANDSLGSVWVLGVQPATGGAAATGSVAFTGTATSPGTIYPYVAGALYQTAVNIGDTATIIAANVAATITAAGNAPVTAAASLGTLTLTSVNVGAVWNSVSIGLNTLGTAAGQTLPVGIGATVTAMAGGTGTVTLPNLDTTLLDQGFDFVVNPYTDATNRAAVSAEWNNQTGRWSPLRLLYGHVFSADVDTSANLITLGTSLNDPHLTMFGVTGTPTPPWSWAAAHAGAIAPAIRADPARPTQTLAVNGVIAPPNSTRFTKSTQQTLLSSGIALSAYNNAGQVSVLRAVTTYQTNAFGQPDTSYLDCETLYTLAAVSRQLGGAIQQKFPRSKIAANGTRFGAGQPVVTPNVMKSEIVAQYQLMEAAGLVQSASAMAASTVVALNASDPTRMDVLWAPYLISGLREVAIVNQFRLAAALAA